MCLSRSTASGVEEANTGITVTNPLAEEEADNTYSTDKGGKSNEDIQDNPYNEVEI